METIIENLKLEMKERVENEEYLSLLKEVGMGGSAVNLPVITPLAISEYLAYMINKLYPPIVKEVHNRRIGFMGTIKDHVRKESFVVDIFTPSQRESGSISRRFFPPAESYAREMVWLETPVENFIGRPPTHILRSIKANKEVFDQIVIVTVKDVKIKLEDPLVCGVLKGNPNRYLIDWWGNDIDISEINMK